MAKKGTGGDTAWFNWAVFIVGILYLLSVWIPASFQWWARSFPFDGVFFTLAGIWMLMKCK